MQIWLLASRTLGISQHILPQSLIYVRVVHRQLPNYVALARFVRSSALVWTTPVYFPLCRFTQITIWCYRRPSHVATGGPPNSSFWSVYKPPSTWFMNNSGSKQLMQDKRVSNVSAHNGFGPWAEQTIFSTGEQWSVFARMGRINRVCNRCQRVPWTETTNLF